MLQEGCSVVEEAIGNSLVERSVPQLGVLDVGVRTAGEERLDDLSSN